MGDATGQEGQKKLWSVCIYCDQMIEPISGRWHNPTQCCSQASCQEQHAARLKRLAEQKPTPVRKVDVVRDARFCDPACPACGEVHRDTVPDAREGGVRVQRDRSREDRLYNFRRWHREQLPRQCYMVDIDALEVRVRADGEIRAGAHIEMTRVDGGLSARPQRYLEKVLQRYENEGIQGKASRWIAARLGCHAYLVVFDCDLKTYWRFDLTDGGEWLRLDDEHYARWLRGL